MEVKMTVRTNRASARITSAAVAIALLSGCGGDDPKYGTAASATAAPTATAPAPASGPAAVAPPAADSTANAAGTKAVVIDWEAPTEYEDGSPFIDLAGYRIWYGRAPGNYSGLLEIAPGMTSHKLHSLAPATYYFSITAYNYEGTESTLSNEIMIRLN
jgi:hypothetical protein